MAEVLLKCVIRETKSIYRKFYEKYKPLLFVFGLSFGGIALGFIISLFVLWLDGVIESNWQTVMLFVNALIILYNFVAGIIIAAHELFTGLVYYVMSLPPWFTGFVVFLLVSVGYPVTKAFVICVKRAARKSNIAEV
jgi:hypothetical protein